MCGICGVWGLEDRELVKRMCDVIAHRGPDDSGFYVGSGITLGNRRLSIIDVAGGHQPIHNEEESIWITYNGEIYNHLGLREELEEVGHDFYTESDTEVIVHLYEEHGERCLEKLRGMFAFAIWDANKKKLLLARDRLGIKPLYYAKFDDMLFFASEAKSILQYRDFPREVNISALNSFITYRFVPGKQTLFKGIKRLSPGSFLTFDGDKWKTERYWDVEMSPLAGKGEDYFSAKLLEMLRECVKMRLMSEVPLGAYLSGGVDSSSVVSIMSSLSDEPIKTFSIGFGDPDFDELVFAREVAECFGTEHRELVVEPDAAMLLPEIIWHFDEPVADPAAIPTYLLSEFAKKHVTVVLTGEGGDEIFGGYEQYKIMKVGERYLKRIPLVLRTRGLPWVIGRVPKGLLNRIFRYSSSLGEEGIKRFSDYMVVLEDRGRSYLALVSIFDEEERGELYSGGLGDEAVTDIAGDLNKRYFANTKKSDLLNSLIYLELKTSLPENLLMKVDKMTMAHSIEARVPLLDHRIVELAGTVPPQLKLKGFKEKYILRKTMANILPKKILKREKQRFFVPIHTWLEGEFGEVAAQILSPSAIKKRDYLDSSYIDKLFRDFNRSKLYYSRQLWNLITFEIWYRICIEREDVYKPHLSLDKLH